MKWTQDDGTCEVLTYKAGLLSAVGHDLLLKVERWELTLEDDAIEGSFDGTSFQVVGAMRDGRVDTSVLSAKDQRDIVENIRKHVFKRHQAQRIRFACDDVEETDDGLEGDGTLTIDPRSHGVHFEVEVDGGQAVCEIVLHQPDWGITPFKALMGALKIQPDVRVRITVPWS